MAQGSEPPHFPEEEEGMPGIHIDITHNLTGTGGSKDFSGAFHGAGSGGVEAVDPHATHLGKLERLDMDAATGYHRSPGHAGAHPVVVHGPGALGSAPPAAGGSTAGGTPSAGVGAGAGPSGGVEGPAGGNGAQPPSTTS